MTDVATEPLSPAPETPAPAAKLGGVPRATMADLDAKKRAEREVAVEVPGPDGPKQVSFLFRAISRKEYDLLIDAHPPTKIQVAKGDQFNVDTFAPTLLANVCVEPEIDAPTWGRYWKSPEWSNGELMGLFFTAQSLCNSGFDLVPTTAGD
jgi:hypothetical protein